MKRILFILLISHFTLASQNRVVVSTEQIRHAFNSERPDCLDNETTPFTGTLIQMYSGDTLFIRNYKDGIIDGLSVEFKPMTGIRTNESNYKNGKPHGEQIAYYPVYKDEDNPKPVVLVVGQKDYFENGIQQGISYEYFESGKIQKTTTYVDGKLKGKVVVYDESGSIIEQGEYQ